MDDGAVIARARKAVGLSQSELAARSGVAQPNISAYESGARRPSRNMVERLIAAMRPRPSVVLAAHRDDVKMLARANKASNVRVFGSIARSEDTPGTDIDLLVRFDEGSSLLDQSLLALDLAELLGIGVDVVSEAALTHRHGEIIREAVAL